MKVRNSAQNIAISFGASIISEGLLVFLFCFDKGNKNGQTLLQESPFFTIACIAFLACFLIILLASEQKTILFTEVGFTVQYLWLIKKHNPWSISNVSYIQPGVFSSVFSGDGIMFYTGRKRLFRPFDASMYCLFHPLSRCFVLFQDETKKTSPNYAVNQSDFVRMLHEWGVEIEEIPQGRESIM